MAMELVWFIPVPRRACVGRRSFLGSGPYVQRVQSSGEISLHCQLQHRLRPMVFSKKTSDTSPNIYQVSFSHGAGLLY